MGLAVPLDLFFPHGPSRASSPPGAHIRGKLSQLSLAYRYTCPRSKRIKQWLEQEPHSGLYYTFVAVLYYNTILMCRYVQGNPLANCQIDLTSIPYGQSRGYIKISQGNKIWLEWFPCHTLLNLPISSTIAIDITGGILHKLTHPWRSMMEYLLVAADILL